MPASILDGFAVALQLKTTIAQRVDAFIQQGRRPPGLAVILVGNDAASQIYVQHKEKACLAVGFHSIVYHLPAETSEKALLDLIQSLNERAEIDGILVQLPLPSHINTESIIEQIHPKKDVDGFHPYNIGRLAQGHPTLRPCTPYGIIRLLDFYHLSLQGKNAVVIGASNIVGRPMALELLAAKATVTVCHRSTKNIESHVQQGDIIVVAAGSRGIISPDWLHEHQIIVDVGMHRLQDGTLCGDVDFTAAKQKVAWITPVPKGIGPMTIAMLLENTLSCYSSSSHSNSSSSPS